MTDSFKLFAQINYQWQFHVHPTVENVPAAAHQICNVRKQKTLTATALSAGFGLLHSFYRTASLNMEVLLRMNLPGLLVEMFTLYSLQSHNGKNARFRMTSLSHQCNMLKLFVLVLPREEITVMTLPCNRICLWEVSHAAAASKCICAGNLQCTVSVSLSAAIKVNCNGFCGITNKVNDTAWTMEEQYFNSTVSVADKGTLLNDWNAENKVIQRVWSILQSISDRWVLAMLPCVLVYHSNLNYLDEKPG